MDNAMNAAETFTTERFSLCLSPMAGEFVVSVFPVSGGEANCDEELFMKRFRSQEEAEKVFAALEQTIRARHVGRRAGTGRRNPLDMLMPSNAFMVAYKMALGLQLR